MHRETFLRKLGTVKEREKRSIVSKWMEERAQREKREIRKGGGEGGKNKAEISRKK